MEHNSTGVSRFVTTARSLLPKRLYRGEPVWVVSYASANAAKVRSASVGDYANHLSAVDIAYIESTENRIGNPFKAFGDHR